MTDWRQELIDAYPHLFRLERDGGDFYTPGYPTTGDGWSDLIGRAIARIAAADVGRSVRIDQIKQKFGTLRLYWSSIGAIDDETDAAIEEAIALAEARSECTCETCGAEGALHRDEGWYATACHEHARGERVEVKPGYEGIRIVETFTSDGSQVSCRRYLRETDSFVDVDPATLPKDE